MEGHKTQTACLQALQLCERFGEVAEAEQHHPDLHLTVRPAALLLPWTHSSASVHFQRALRSWISPLPRDV